MGAINMGKGIDDEDAASSLPYYRQVGLNVYRLPEEDREPYFVLVYRDVKAAFSHYLEYYNSDRPIVLTSFSQGEPICAYVCR